MDSSQKRPGSLVIDFFSLVSFFCLFYHFSFFVMGGSTYFFVESKTFEFLIEEGGTFYLFHIFERGRDLPHFVALGKESAKRLLFNVEELVSKESPVQFS